MILKLKRLLKCLTLKLVKRLSIILSRQILERALKKLILRKISANFVGRLFYKQKNFENLNLLTQNYF